LPFLEHILSPSLPLRMVDLRNRVVQAHS
jgi:hypothetical protein